MHTNSNHRSDPPCPIFTEGFRPFASRASSRTGSCSTDWRCGDQTPYSADWVQRFPVDPAILTDSAPGDLFVVRNVANLGAALRNHRSLSRHQRRPGVRSFATRVHNAIVLGHSHCGGISPKLTTTVK